ncbi:MAG: hypothetical protein ACFN4D_02795, partial [Cardiobacterium sp.]
FQFFQSFAALTPALSRYASNACPTGRGGILAVFPVFSFLHKHTEKCGSPRFRAGSKEFTMQPDSHDHYGSVSRFLHWAWRLLLR